MPRDLNRRGFLASAGGAVGMALLPGSGSADAGPAAAPSGSVILFQGDSITDTGRNRTQPEPNRASALGNGYVLLLASELLRDRPERDFQIYNRGISGNKVPDLQARWEADAVALKPDILSILIGVNDIWHKLNNRSTGTVADYETGYTALLESTASRLPSARIVVLEPFVLRTGAVDARWFPEFDERRAAAARVARRAGAIWVPLQEEFDRLARRSGPAYWAADGVHPTAAGHSAIARRWRKAVGL